MNRIARTITALIGRSVPGHREVSQLAADISTYTTKADLLELHEILSRYTPEEAADIRRAVHGSVLV